MASRKREASMERRRRLVALQRVVDLCNCTWPLDIMRNGDGHADDCPAHNPL